MEKVPFSRLILGSASPRRKSLLKSIGFAFDVVTADIEEVFPMHLEREKITDYLAIQKAWALKRHLDSDTLILTADTIVWFDGAVMEKPGHREEAERTLKALSGNWHEVITSVCFTTEKTQFLKHAITRVKFAPLTDQMIQTYIGSGQPMDKAGAYGIQEWIGLVGVERIDGSYTNVVGLPTQLVYKTLSTMAGSAI
ncbi:Maf family nucleotide pyrophosphatase [Robiginitalea aurantiaca]|uniref:dTTP/UTP pyrophosphatase n=1 Tax=Robiginitalea aurantiaca TaxID=3056915 RepID=A0ABT7WH98_9FLAO|nr:Maf family nucleotide pyrophosphatase [Robiginitalea aurantiaca]MDM9632184.1 Maf family nucleotide pyrophosphatase [Robiginitalea aurantiaca]